MHENLRSNIWAVGRNYAEHIKELGNHTKAAPTNPMIFLKSSSSIVENGQSFTLPEFSQDIHHEVEVALRFGSNLRIDAFTVALDLTARDVQNKLKEAGHPWTLAKSFKNSCPLGAWKPLSPSEVFPEFTFSLKVNGELRQSGDTKDMIFSMQKICDYLLKTFAILPGDIVLTGTPSGVAQIKAGDVLEAEIQNHVKARWSVGSSHA